MSFRQHLAPDVPPCPCRSAYARDEAESRKFARWGLPTALTMSPAFDSELSFSVASPRQICFRSGTSLAWVWSLEAFTFLSCFMLSGTGASCPSRFADLFRSPDNSNATANSTRSGLITSFALLWQLDFVAAATISPPWQPVPCRRVPYTSLPRPTDAIIETGHPPHARSPYACRRRARDSISTSDRTNRSSVFSGGLSQHTVSTLKTNHTEQTKTLTVPNEIEDVGIFCPSGGSTENLD